MLRTKLQEILLVAFSPLFWRQSRIASLGILEPCITIIYIPEWESPSQCLGIHVGEWYHIPKSLKLLRIKKEGINQQLKVR